MEPLVRLLGVSKKFGDAVALEPTDLDFAPGLTTALIGPSGCGKSTLLRLIIGLLEPDRGEVIFDGSKVDADNAPASAGGSATSFRKAVFSRISPRARMSS